MCQQKYYVGSPFLLRLHCNPLKISKTLYIQGLKIQYNNPGFCVEEEKCKQNLFDHPSLLKVY